MTSARLQALPAPWVVRPLGAHDVDSLLHIQSTCYGDDFQESRAVFAQRLACAHQCSIGVVRAGDPMLSAYLAAYWSSPGKITPLDGAFTPRPRPRRCFTCTTCRCYRNWLAKVWRGIWCSTCLRRHASAACSAQRWCRCRAHRLIGNVKAFLYAP